MQLLFERTFLWVYNIDMNIKITSKDFEVTPAIEEYINKKISSLEKFLGSDSSILCEVEVGKTTGHQKSGDIFRTEINIVEPGNQQVFVVANEADIYTSIDVVRGEAERVIVSKKSKRDTLVRRSGSKIKDLIKRFDFRKNK